jgi:hypothetical protein
VLALAYFRSGNLEGAVATQRQALESPRFPPDYREEARQQLHEYEGALASEALNVSSSDHLIHRWGRGAADTAPDGSHLHIDRRARSWDMWDIGKVRLAHPGGIHLYAVSQPLSETAQLPDADNSDRAVYGRTQRRL